MTTAVTKLRHTLTDTFVRLESEELLLLHVSLDILRDDPKVREAWRVLCGAAIDSVALKASREDKT